MVLALVALASGSLMITPFLTRVSDGAIRSELYEAGVVTQYSSDAALEDGLWNVIYGDFGATVLDDSGDTTTFESGEPVNGVQPTVTIIRDWVQYAVEDFESGGWTGGTGWSAPWTTSGDAVVQTAEAPHEGSYHLRLRNAGTTARSTSLSNIFDAHLYFWGRVDGFNPNDDVRLLFSADGTNWTTARTWTNADNNTSYQFNDFDLAAYGDSAQFWVKFESNLGGSNRQFFVDHIVVATPLPGASLGLPRDPFESGDLAGGSGWLADWAKNGNAEVEDDNAPYQGQYHLQVKAAPGYVERSVDLSGRSDLRLQFWAKLVGVEDPEYAEALVSSDYVNWTVVQTWTSADSGLGYRFVDIDLSGHSMTSQFWIAFNSGFGQGNDFLYVDDLAFTGPVAYRVLVEVGGEQIIESDVIVKDGQTTIITWETGDDDDDDDDDGDDD